MIYLDTSVVFSIHFRDANTPNALALVRGATESLLITPLCELEAVNAFSLRVFRKEMLPINRDNAVRDLENDIRLGVLLFELLPESAFARAKTLAQLLTPSTGVRVVDLLHVAAALELGADTFYTFDVKQHRTARAASLNVNRLS